MSARTKARKRAIDLLYGVDLLHGADLRPALIAAAVELEATRASAEPGREMSWDYAKTIVEGVAEHGQEIDELIESYAQDWTIKRMPALDRTISRIGIWEIVFNAEVPNGVAISEAVDAARTYSTEDSAGFVNGLLGRIAQTRA